MWSRYERLVNYLGDKLVGWLLHPNIDAFIAKQTNLQHHQSRRIVFAGTWIVISVVIVVITWYLHALTHGGVNAALEKYDTKLPRISYTGANAPAYYFFCTLIPIGCLMIREPVFKITAKLQSSLVEMGLPLTSGCHCFWCCCCCCIDGSRFTPPLPLHTSVEEGTTCRQPGDHRVWSSKKPSCTCSPYLPYMIMAMGPLVDITIHGMVVLTVVSISYSILGRIIHLFGAICFFYGMIALEGCYVFSLIQIHKIWPYEFEHRFGFDLSSFQFKIHKASFSLRLFILIFFDYLMWIITFAIGYYTGEWGALKFQFRYITALSQWTMIILVVVSVLTFAYDVDNFITKQKLIIAASSSSSSSTVSSVVPTSTTTDKGKGNIELESP